MCYYISAEGKKPCDLIFPVICTLRNNIGDDKKYVNYDAKYAPQLEDMYTGLLNTSNKLMCDDHKYDSTPAQGVYLGEISYVYKKMEIDSDMNISD